MSLGNLLNPIGSVTDYYKNRRAERRAREEAKRAAEREAAFNRRREAQQDRLGALDWQPALLQDSVQPRQQTPMKADLDYLASMLGGFSSTSANPWDAPGTQEAMNAKYKQTYGKAYTDQAQADDEAFRALKYDIKRPKEVDTTALTMPGEDVGGKRNSTPAKYRK